MTTYTNIKCDEFEFNGANYAGFSYPDTVKMFSNTLTEDGFDHVTDFKHAVQPTPHVFVGHLISMSHSASPVAGYYVITAAP